MPVNSTHAEYDANATAWLRARDVFAGEDAVKAAGVRYLPRLDSQTDDEYAAYKSRASFFNATARTADGFVGLIFRREPTIKLPDEGKTLTATNGFTPDNPHPASGHPLPLPRAREQRSGSGVGRALAAFAEDADMQGTSLPTYAKNVVSEIFAVGRAGTLVDWESEVEQRAYAVLYAAEQILNWRTERVNGRNVLTLVVLREVSKKPVAEDDPFVPDDTEQLRVLRLVENNARPHPGPLPQGEGERGGGSRKYVVEIWQQVLANGHQKKSKRSQTEWRKVETRIPLRLGKPLPLIPFAFHGPRHSLPEVDKLPLADIIAVNLDHYRLNADYKHGLHFTALPTAWVSGFDKSATLRIGSSTAWVSETPGATAGFLEFTGQGLMTFERAMDRNERLMAVLGTRMLEAQKRVAETAEAIELRQSGESSVLSAVSLSVSNSLTQILRWIFWWNSTEETPEAIGEDRVLVQLNSDFSTKGMASDEIAAVVAAWQANAISRETMFELFRKGEVLPPGRSNQDELLLVGREKVVSLQADTGIMK